MSNDIVLRQSSLLGAEDYDDLGAGIRSSFPVLSYRGQHWWLWYQKQELAIVDAQGALAPEIGVSLLKVPANLSKRYFARAYQKGERGRPECWSDDGKKPHPNAMIPQQPDGRVKPTLCAHCFMDTIGSATSADKTKRMKACSDYKRVAVKLVSPLFGRMLIGNAWADQLVPLDDVAELAMLLSVPTASLNNLKEYGKFLEGHKAHAIGRVTWIGFVPTEAFPKLTFRHGAEFDDQTILTLRELRNSDDTANVIAREASLDNASAGEPLENGQPTVPEQTQTAPQAALGKPVAVATPQLAPIPAPVIDLPIPPTATARAEATVTPIKPAFVPGGKPVKPNTINQAIANPAEAPPSVRTVVATPTPGNGEDSGEGLGYNEADIPSEVDQMFQALKLEVNKGS